MKKSIVLMVAVCAMAAGVSAGPFGDLSKTLNSFDTKKAEAATGTVPEGREILPILWKYAYDEPTLEGKVVGFSAKITKLQPIDNEYTFVQDVIFKFGIGLQDQQAQVRIVQDGTTFSVETLSMNAYSVDNTGKKKGDAIEVSKKGAAQNAKNIADELSAMAKNLSEADYQKWYDAAYTDLHVQQTAGKVASNKLKAKKWYGTHVLEGKTITTALLVANVDESKKAGYAYKVSGLVGEVIVDFYTNTDAYIDVKESQSIKITGTAVKVQYTPDYESFYGVSSVVIEE